jgi:hypothetical protein
MRAGEGEEEEGRFRAYNGSAAEGERLLPNGRILFDPNKPCAAPIEPVSESSENDRNNDGEPASIVIPSGSRGSENETINDARVSGNDMPFRYRQSQRYHRVRYSIRQSQWMHVM